MATASDTGATARTRSRRRPGRWSFALDVALIGVIVVMLLVDDATQIFKLVFFLLTIAAFFWDRGTFILRAVFWTSLTTAVLVGLLSVGRLPAVELLDVPFAVGVLVLVFSVTDRRDEARREIDRLLAVEQDRSRELEEVAQLKADFTAVVVHEFGNPLAAMRRLTEMMDLDGLDDESRLAVVRYATEALRTEIGALDRLVADVQTAVAVDREDFVLRPRPVPVQDLLADAVGHAESLVGSGRVSVRSVGVEQLHVVADPDRIAQVLRNLVSNAAKHTPADAALVLGAHRSADGRVEFTVEDDGPGLDPEDLERIFERFGRGRRSGRVEGLGLGLYISQRLVRAHGGDLVARSEPGGGAVFGFSLEVATP